MKSFNKIIVVGRESLHIESFFRIIKNHFIERILICEDKVNYPHVTKNYHINFRSYNPLKIWKSYANLKTVIKTEKPDVVHIQSINRMAFLCCLILEKLTIPFVSTAWGSDVLIVPNKNIVAKKMVQRVLKNSSCVTADSMHMLKAIEVLSQTKRKELFFFGIKPIETGRDKEKLIYSNRLHNKLYNIDLIIDDFFEFQKTNPDWRLVIGAIGSETENLKKKVEDLNISSKVEFIGWLSQEDNSNYYQLASIYVSIPSSDGTAVSLLEAMSAGCIPVVGDLVVSKEWIDNNINGIIRNEHGENSFFLASQLNLKQVADINKEIINSKATVKIATENIYKLYDTLIHD